MKSALVLVPPNIPSMDSAAGARYQATYNASGSRASHWLPLWVCYAAGAVPTARAMDCNVSGISRDEFLKTAPDYDAYVFYANQETIAYDQETARLLYESRNKPFIVFAGPYACVASEKIIASPGISGVIRGEIESPLRDLCNELPISEIRGLTWKDGEKITANPDADRLEDLDSLPWVSRIIQRDLPLMSYWIPYLKFPYISILTGRGCPHQCSYCLWPQTIGGHRYRKRSIADVAAEMLWIRDTLPEIKEIQIEDDTFTCQPERVRELCDALEGQGITWSCCSRVDVSLDLLTRMKKAGARNLVVGFESGNDQILKNIRKGLNTDQARKFMKNARQAGMQVHGCFVFGLPGETRETMKQTLNYALELHPDTVQFAIAVPYEGTAFNAYLRDNGFLRDQSGITETGHLSAPYDYPQLSGEEINKFSHYAWRSYYLRPSTIFREIFTQIRSFKDLKRFLKGVVYIGDYIFMKQPHQQKKPGESGSA